MKKEKKFNFVFWYVWFLGGLFPLAYMNFELHFSGWYQCIIILYIFVFYVGSFLILLKLHPIEKKENNTNR